MSAADDLGALWGTAPVVTIRRNPMRDLLHARFPKCFADYGERKTPLKIGIYHDLRKACPDLKAKALHYALVDYTGGPTYHHACVVGAPRIDLEGNLVGTVTHGAALHHAVLLNDLKRKWRKRALVPVEEAKRHAS